MKQKYSLKGPNRSVGEELFYLENSIDVVVDVVNSFANPFNYLLDTSISDYMTMTV